MNTLQALDELEKAAAAAGYAMASQDDDNEFVTLPASGDAVARGSRVPSVKAALAALPPSGPSSVTRPNAIIQSATSVRETVYGYLGISATA